MYKKSMVSTIIIDNYDSFTYNLLHIVEQYAKDVSVRRNDEITLTEIDAYSRIIISPGPGLPSDVPLLKEIILEYGPVKPILGICLGHQAIAEVYGATLQNMQEVNHGIEKYTIVSNVNEPLFNDVPHQFFSGRYHSWVVDTNAFPSDLEIIATDADGHIMAIKHRHYRTYGVQFHPESIMTPLGSCILSNWLNDC